MEDVIWWYAYCIWVSYDETFRKIDFCIMSNRSYIDSDNS